jgi:flagella basal body P-ring formation protein FlgA
MTSSANRGLAAMIAAALGLSAWFPAAASADPDAASAERVRTAIAARWAVAPETIQLVWGRCPAEGLPATAFRLLGGADGWFVLAFVAHGGDATSVRVRAGVDESVCVATRDLARDTRLAPDDLRLESRIHWGAPRSHAVRPEAGWTLRRAVTAGSVLDRPTVEPPILVNVGDAVELDWSRGAVAMRMSGIALHDAHLGDVVRVRVEGRPRPLLGLVDAPGHARIGTREAS